MSKDIDRKRANNKPFVETGSVYHKHLVVPAGVLATGNMSWRVGDFDPCHSSGARDALGMRRYTSGGVIIKDDDLFCWTGGE